MKVTKLLLMTVASMFMVSSYAQTRDEIAAKYNSGGEALNTKNYAEAAKVFKEALDMVGTSDDDAALEIEPTILSSLGDAHRMMGMTTAHAKDYDTALVDFEKAADYYKKGGNIMMQRKSEEFITLCYTQMVGVKAKEGDFAAASAICEKGIEANPQSTKLMILAAQCYQKGGNDAKSIEMYGKVIELGNKFPRLKNDGVKASGLLVNGQLAAANELMSKGNNKAALEKVNTALKYSPESVEAVLIKMSIYNKDKNYTKIIAEGPSMANSVADAGTKSDINFMVGAAYIAKEDNKNALTYYKKVTAGKYVQQAKDQIVQINKALEAAAK